MSDSVIKITDSEVDVQQIMRDIREEIARKRNDPEYRKRLERLEAVSPIENDEVEGDIRLVDKMHVPPSHRTGVTGKLADAILNKLYLASKSFMSGVLSSQERINRTNRKTLQQCEQAIADLTEQVERVNERHALGDLKPAIFDYKAFEDKFRGTEAEIKERQEMYVSLFTRPPVLDIGCGRGEFLELMQEKEIEARGIDTNEGMVNHCVQKGLDVSRVDAVSYLRRVAEDSLGGIFAAHIVEHVPPGYLMRLLSYAHRALQKDGVLVCETPNPSTLSIFSYGFYIDPTHLRPVHSEELRFMFEQVGFTAIEIRPSSPVPVENQLLVPEDEPMKTNVQKLNEHLYGAQDYAIIGRK